MKIIAKGIRSNDVYVSCTVLFAENLSSLNHNKPLCLVSDSEAEIKILGVATYT